MIRQPAVAGRFYEGESRALESEVEHHLEPGAEKLDAVAAMCPHAGLVYSGSVAGAVYSRLKAPDTFVLLGPNHTGLGSAVSLITEGAWVIPTGSVEIDSSLAAAISQKCPQITLDEQAHMFEHSLEVQLPFIARLFPGAQIVPVCIMSASASELVSMGEGIAAAIEESTKAVVVIASSDMSHFLPDKLARQQDELALERVMALDPSGLYDTVRKEGISMCGYMPVTAMLAAANALGAKEPLLVKYSTSAEVSGDYSSVVGYAGIIIS